MDTVSYELSLFYDIRMNGNGKTCLICGVVFGLTQTDRSEPDPVARKVQDANYIGSNEAKCEMAWQLSGALLF